MDGFSVGDIILPADTEQQIAAQLAANGYNFAVQPGAQTAAAPQTAASNFAVQPGASDISYGNVDLTQVAAPSMPGLSVKSGMVTERGMGPNPDLAVQPTPGVTVNPQASGSPEAPTVAAQPSAAFDYSKLVTGEPQLQTGPLQLSGGRSFTPETPYYAAYTNSGDAAGAVYAGEGQKVRLVDPTTGDVVFEGTGPEGAKQAVAIANATSSSQGRKASWQIQGDFGDQGWKAMAEDKVDPKHNLLGKLADIALPVVGAIVGGPIGAGLASAASSVAQGRSLKDTLIRAALSAGGTYVGGKLPLPGAGGATGGGGGLASLPGNAGTVAGTAGGGGIVDAASGIIMNSAGQVLGQGTTQALAQVGANVAAKGVGTVVEELVVTGLSRAAAQSLVNQAIASGFAGAAANAGAGALQNAGSTPSADTNATNASATTQSQPTDVGEVVVTGAKPAPAPTTALPPAVSELVVTAAKADLDHGASTQDVIDRYGYDAWSAAVGAIDPLTVTAQPKVDRSALPGVVSGLVNAVPSLGGPKTLLDAVKTGDPKQIGDWIAANPLQAATLGITVAGALGGGGGGGGGGTYGIPTGAGAPGTRSSLSPIFSAGLPPPSARFAARQPRDMAGVDWKRYGMGPERSFFTNVPQGASDRLAVAPASGGTSAASTGASSASAYPAFAVVQNRLAMDSGRGPAPEGKRYIQRDDGVILLVDDSPEATYKGRSGATKKVRDLSVYQGGFTSKPISDFAAANTPEVIANLRSVGGLPMRRGGGVPNFAVQGDGDGREDAIPARLSDGEYVIDAETVALLGNGSSKAGAAKLDQFRVNVRKHKGRELAKGKFSADAKRPEAYLAGGRT